ncbi:MAG: hypothetical protein GTN99_06300 [Candidatus Dadabacteria bacterium]|nr:hypothetical protein [Candidatus Dadabacteria bacterium]NIT13846.1 hypothetical protein [Candidatus Dadabacteria bacterium]
MSRLFLIKLEFALILLFIISVSISINKTVHAQSSDINNHIDSITALIEEVEKFNKYIPEDSLNQPKAFIQSITGDTKGDVDSELINKMALSIIEYLNALETEAKNKFELEKTSQNIIEEQKKHERLIKYNSEITQELNKFK